MTISIDIIVLIVNSVAAFVGIVAAVVAIRGNREAKRQFEENMAIQKRSLNLSLFDERMTIYEKIKRKNFEFSRDRAGFLFDDRIISLIMRYDRVKKTLHEYESAKKEISDSLINEMFENEHKGIKSPNFPDLIYKCTYFYPYEWFSEEEYNEIRKILNAHPQLIEFAGEFQFVSYVDVDTMAKEYSFALKNIHKTLVDEIKTFIDLSLADGEKYLK